MADPTPISSLNEPVSFSLIFNKKPLPVDYIVYSASVTKEVNKIGRASIKILGGDPYLNSFDEAESTEFKPGTDVEIKMGYDQSNTTCLLYTSPSPRDS